MSLFVGKVVRLGVVLAVVVAGLAVVGPGVSAQTVGEVVERDRLIADQEALLNVYRCMFSVDTQVVPGGCSNGEPALPAKGPDPFSGTPTALDIAVRDKLVVEQEALLNVYRCQFSIDTDLVPGGCQDDSITTTPENFGPAPPNEEAWSEYVSIGEFIAACGFWEGTYLRCHNHPEDTEEVGRLLGELFGCEWSIERGGCRGYSGVEMWRLDNELFCQNGWIFQIDFQDENHSVYCYHPDHPTHGLDAIR